MTIHRLALIGDPPEHRDHRDSPGLPPMIDDSARIEAFVSVDAGLAAPTRIWHDVWLMKHCHVGHDAVIGPRCELAPGCIVGGHVTIGKDVRVGMGATFKPFVTVGDGARIGCGAVVISNIPAGEIWAGNPARCIGKYAMGPTAADVDEDERRQQGIRDELERLADAVGKPSHLDTI